MEIISEVEQKKRRFERLAYLLDRSIKIPRTSIEIGVDSLLGLVPVAGDFAGAGLSLYLLYQAFIIGVSKSKLLKMVSNSIVDALFGAMPLLGDLFDVYWKSNSMNADILAQAIAQDKLEPRNGNLLLLIIFLLFSVFFLALLFFLSLVAFFLFRLIFA